LVHFYETFLAEYDPKKRRSRGIYYTPLPVVSFIARSVNIILKEKFGIKDGLAGEEVTLLDPAAGTLTFPVLAIRLAIEEYSKQWGLGGTKSFIKDHILKHFYAFELEMAPYVIGHLKISLLLQELGYEFDIEDKSDRFKLFLTNTLDFDPVKESNLPFSFALSEEAKNAEKVKKEEEILVIFGNPPYSSSASEPTKFSKEKMKDYLTGLGVEDEKKKGAIQDDYVRFIRFAHWKISQDNKGIVGFITNNSYLDGLVHRAMRKKLLDDFDEIYIVNLHGSTLKKEKTPAGGKDENVFDIRPGVAIVLMVKLGHSSWI
jgi:predicted helicase